MAITTIDQLIAGMQPPINFAKYSTTGEGAGIPHSLFHVIGVPGQAAAPSPGLAGAALTSYTGQIPFTNPSSGNAYLARFAAQSNIRGLLSLYDRLWHNSGIAVTTTTAQTINSAAWPARDIAGSTNGDGVMVGIEVSTATTNGSAVTNTTMDYTNEAGTASRTATIPSFPQTAQLGTFIPFALAAGDKGVRSIQSVTLGTSYGGGAIHLVAYRLIATLALSTSDVGFAIDAVSGGMPRMFNDSVPFLAILPQATPNSANIMGSLVYAHG